MILCLETFCSLAQQRRIAEMLVSAFGRMLLRPGELLSEDGQLPSPEQARYRILVMSKKRGINGGDDVSVSDSTVYGSESLSDDALLSPMDDLASPKKLMGALFPKTPPPPIRNPTVAQELSELMYFDDFALRSTLDHPSSECVARVSEAHFDPEAASSESVASLISFNHDCLRYLSASIHPSLHASLRYHLSLESLC